MARGNEAHATSRPDAPAAARRNDKWKVIGMGGGGAQYIPTVSPHDPNKIFVRCDMTGSYLSEDGGKSWRMFNLRGVVRFFVFDPVDPDTMYAKSSALYRSSDGGRTWQLVHPAASKLKGLRISDDHAKVEMVTGGRGEEIIALTVDPARSKTLYAAMEKSGAVSLVISSDRGKTWQQAGKLPAGALAIYVDPASPVKKRRVYVVGEHSVSLLDAGAWTHHKPVRGGGRFVSVSAGFAKGGSGPVIYGVTPCKWQRGKLSGGVFVSVNGGATWKNVSGDLARRAKGTDLSPSIRGISCCQTRPETAYIGFNGFQLSRGKTHHFGCARTTDAGATWQIVLVETDPGQSAPNMHDAWLSERFGPIWGDAPRYLGVDPNNPNRCFTTDDGRTMRTTDGGKTWRACYSKKARGGWTTTGLDVLTCYGVHFDPFDGKRVLISYTDIGFIASSDGGKSWRSGTTNGVPREWTNTTYWLEFDACVKGRCWGVFSPVHDLPRPKMWRRGKVGNYSGGVCVSDDGGRSWKRSTGGMTQSACTHIIIDPDSPPEARVLYVAGYGDGVWKSTNGGRSWQLKNNGIAGNEPFAWRLARDSNGALYLVVARRSDDGSYDNDLDGALYRSTDGARSWEKITLPRGVNGPNDVAVDPADPDKLYLAAWARDTKAGPRGGGVFVSTNGGKTWKNVLSKDQHIYSLTVDPRNRKVVYACGFESTVHRSEDGGKTWRRVKGFNFKWGHRVTPDPHNRGMIYVSTFGGSVWYGPAKGDPRAPEDITSPVVRFS